MNNVSDRRPAIPTPYVGQGMAADVNNRYKRQLLKYPNNSASPLGVELTSVPGTRSSYLRKQQPTHGKSQEDTYLNRYILAVKTAQNLEHPGRFPKKNTGEVHSKVEEIERQLLISPFKVTSNYEKSSQANTTEIDSTSENLESGMSIGFVTPQGEVEGYFEDPDPNHQTGYSTHLPPSVHPFDSSSDVTSEETSDSESQTPEPISAPTPLDQSEDFTSKSVDKPQKNEAKASNSLIYGTQGTLLALGIGYIHSSYFKDAILTPYVMPWVDFCGRYISTPSDFWEISSLIPSSNQLNPANILPSSSESTQPNVIIDATDGLKVNFFTAFEKPSDLSAFIPSEALLPFSKTTQTVVESANELFNTLPKIDPISQSTPIGSKANLFTAIETPSDLSAFIPSEAPPPFPNTTQTVAESASRWFNNLPKIDESMALKVAVGIALVAGSIYVGSIAYKYIYPQVAETLPIEVEQNYTEEILEEKPQSTLEWLTSKFWSTASSVSKFFNRLLSFLFSKHS